MFILNNMGNNKRQKKKNKKNNKSNVENKPFVSLCTPTFNRRPFINYMINDLR